MITPATNMTVIQCESADATLPQRSTTCNNIIIQNTKFSKSKSKNPKILSLRLGFIALCVLAGLGDASSGETDSDVASELDDLSAPSRYKTELSLSKSSTGETVEGSTTYDHQDEEKAAEAAVEEKPEEKVPDQYLCTKSGKVMCDPVIWANQYVRCTLCNRVKHHPVARLRGDAPREEEDDPCQECHNDRVVRAGRTYQKEELVSFLAERNVPLLQCLGKCNGEGCEISQEDHLDSQCICKGQWLDCNWSGSRQSDLHQGPKEGETCPECGSPHIQHEIIPNYAIKSLIEDYIKKTKDSRRRLTGQSTIDRLIRETRRASQLPSLRDLRD